jgi:hypothetical protein
VQFAAPNRSAQNRRYIGSLAPRRQSSSKIHGKIRYHNPSYIRMTQPMPQVGKTGFLAGVTRFMVRS